MGGVCVYITMKKACKYCGKIHERNYLCEKKPQRNEKKIKNIDVFRGSYDWKLKREYIKRRDKHLCQACLNNLQGTIKRINTENLSVHHIKPLFYHYDLRLDDDNLITLCDMHHELAECGKISAELLQKLIPPKGEH